MSTSVYIFPGDAQRIPNLAQKLQAQTKGIYDETRVISRALDALERDLAKVPAMNLKLGEYAHQGLRMRQCREHFKMTLEHMATLLDIDIGTLRRIENGDRRVTRRAKNRLIEHGINIDWIYTGRGSMHIKAVTA